MVGVQSATGPHSIRDCRHLVSDGGAPGESWRCASLMSTWRRRDFVAGRGGSALLRAVGVVSDP
jgi:hypothetical protein